MADTNSELPEGTDKVVTGASATAAAPAGGAGGERGEALVEGGSTAVAPTRARGSGSAGATFTEKLRSGSGKLSTQAADKARGFVGQGIERSAEALANVGKLVGDTATGLDERLGEDYGNYARRAAEAIENAANTIAAKDADELIDDTRNFVRKSPGVALAGAAVAGFVLARLVKSGLESAFDRDEDDEGDGSGRSDESSGA